MYCARDAEQETLHIYFYQKQDDYQNIPVNVSGLNILADNSVQEINKPDEEALGYIYQQFDTKTTVRLNTHYVRGKTDFIMSTPHKTDFRPGATGYTKITNSTLSNITATTGKDTVNLTFNATGRIVYDAAQGSLENAIVNIMKNTNAIGDEFYLPQYIGRNTAGGFAGCLTNKSTSMLYWYAPENYTKDNYSIMVSPPLSGQAIIPSSQANYLGNNLWSLSDLSTSPPNSVNIELQKDPSSGFGFTNFVDISTKIEPANVHLSVLSEHTFNAGAPSKYTFNESLFPFGQQNVAIPLNKFTNNQITVELIFSASSSDKAQSSLGSETFQLTLTKVINSLLPIISLKRTDTYAQYLQYDVYRIRVNTLFAKQLVARANSGLDSVLSMDTQLLEEPALGEGTQITLTLSAYNADIHGTSAEFQILMCNIFEIYDYFPIASGVLSNTESTEITFFLPRITETDFDFDFDFDFDSWELCAKYQKGQTKHIRILRKETGEYVWDKTYGDGSPFAGLQDVSLLPPASEPMDFSGANGLYFWEMFYYVPMMVFKRLLQETRFAEATRWIKYIWSPEGYFVNNQPAPYQWNVRPLQDETSWHADPLDSVDPDAVAQADPMHYKVATFMSMLDLLIARGDAAYRQLERDTLNEAKMWYMQALHLLGDEPYLADNTDWANPRLDEAADKTVHTWIQQALMSVRQQTAAGALRTANSLTAFFLPQQNDKLCGYWQTLAQRLFNLRHNLSIDGQPLSLAIYARPADPAALLSAAVNSLQGGTDLPAAVMPVYRFPVVLESARGMIGQLSQFGSTLLSVTERQDAEALSEMMQTHGAELIVQSIAAQQKNIAEIDADKLALEENRRGAQSRLDSYAGLYDEDVNSGETQSMDLSLSASTLSTTATVSYTVAAALDAVPNIYGLAIGGSHFGAVARAIGTGIEIAASATHTAADRIGQSETWRRRRQEWEIQRNMAATEVKQIDAQLASLAIRREATELQKTYLETQQAQTQTQLAFLRNKFSNKALYSWLRGKLASIYYQFYDLTVSRCLMAQEAYKWSMLDEAASFIRPGAWQSTHAGLMAGETLMLNLAQMEQAYMEKQQREKEVIRTVSLAEIYADLADKAKFDLAKKLVELINAGSGSAGSDINNLKIADGQLQASLQLASLNIQQDYPDSLGKTRRIKQIGVTLPALVGPYQDVRAVLTYGGDRKMPQGCNALAVSHGMNDSGQFQLDFNDSRWLPFEGIEVNDPGTLSLSFPDALSKQKALLLSLTDIILHIRYSIIS